MWKITYSLLNSGVGSLFHMLGHDNNGPKDVGLIYDGFCLFQWIGSERRGLHFSFSMPLSVTILGGI